MNILSGIAGGLEQLIHKLLHILRVYPVRPQPDGDFRRVQIFGLHSGKGVDIDVKSRIVLRCHFRDVQLFPHIAGEIFVSGLVKGRFPEWHTKNLALQFVDDFLLSFAGKPSHKGNVNPRPLPDGNLQSLSRGVNMGDFLPREDGTLGKHIRFADEFAIVVQDFQGAEQIVGGIIREHALVRFIVDKAELGREIIIEPVQFCLGGVDIFIFGGQLHLLGDKPPGAVPQVYQGGGAGLGGCP